MELQKNAAHRIGKRSKSDIADSEGYGGSGRVHLANVEAPYWIFGIHHKAVTSAGPQSPQEGPQAIQLGHPPAQLLPAKGRSAGRRARSPRGCRIASLLRLDIFAVL